MTAECHVQPNCSSRDPMLLSNGMKTLLLQRGVAALTALSLLAPQASLALTPSQWFNTLIRDTEPEYNISATAGFDVEMSNRYYTRTRPTETGTVSIVMSVRTPVSESGTMTSEGAFTFKKFSLKGFDNSFPFTINEPIVFEWKQTADSAYARITTMPASLVAELKKQAEIDLTPIIGTWIQVPMNSADFAAFNNREVQAEVRKELETGPLANTTLITNVRQVSSTKNAKGEEIIRLSGKINPAIPYILYQQRVKEIKTQYPIGALRTMLLKDAYTDYIKLRGIVRGIYLAANINTATKKIERMEFSSTYSEPKKECKWNTTYTKETCTAVGTTTINIKGGMDVKQDTGIAVTAPPTFMTLDQVEDLFRSQMPQYTEPASGMVEPTQTTTTTQM